MTRFGNVFHSEYAAPQSLPQGLSKQVLRVHEKNFINLRRPQKI